MPAKVKIAILCLVAANIIWGASYPIYKWSLSNVPPFTFAFLRFFLASFILLPFVKNSLYVKQQDLKSLFTLSFFGITFGISMMFLGLEFTHRINGPTTNSLGPILLLFTYMLVLHKNARR